MSKRIHVVINPAAGKPEPVLRTLNDVFGPAGVDWDVSVTQEFGDATRQARQAAESGASIVAAYGGDGTVMEVANGLAGTEAALGVLPGGTGNVLSLELEIPQRSEEAARLLVSPDAQIRQIDMGQAGEKSFLLRAYVGFDAQRIELTTREMRDRYGKLAYLIAALKAIPESKAMCYHLTIDGRNIECEGITCIAQNAGNMGVRGLSLVPGTSISDGLLDVIVIHGLDPLSLASALGSIADTPLEPGWFHHWQGSEITIDTDTPQAVIGDGEAWGETPITVNVRPGAVRAICPTPS
jgi:YegS/Rv2252/BmrU family lipid kinase